MLDRKQVGFTKQGTYPAFINVSVENDTVTVMVRSAQQSSGDVGPGAVIHMTKDEWAKFLAEVSGL